MAEPVAQTAVAAAIARIEIENPRLRAITHYDPALALHRAEKVDRAGGTQPLLGLTYVAKDMIDVAGLPTTSGSRLYADTPTARDAPCITRLQAAGAVVLGKANMHELALGGAKNPWFGQVINPLSAAHGTAGTSSGSAAAVAAGFCSFALGTDSGGSNRSPAAATGLFGFKPTNGRLDMTGIRPLAPTLDTLGLLARDAACLAAAFAVLDEGGTDAPPVTLDGRVFGLPTGLYGAVDPAVQASLDIAKAAIVSKGGRLIEVPVHDAASLAAAGRQILCFEAMQTHGAAIDASPERVGEAVHSFVLRARQVSLGDYKAALASLADHRARWAEMLGGIDALLAPVAPGLAPRLTDEQTQVGAAWVPFGAAGADFRIWANTIGIPALALPISRRSGLPGSVQLAARHGADGFLIELSASLERAIKDNGATSSNTGN
jgi:aspartyl-tRNA(Asn)/glutamyl-tRNA(Gln) amidotransferase subunit A